MKVHRMIAVALAAGAALAAHADNDEAQAGSQLLEPARQACTDAAKARGIEVSRIEGVKLPGGGRFQMQLVTEKHGSIDCEFDNRSRTATLLGFAEHGSEAGEGPLVKICEKVADQQGIRLGRFDEMKALPGRRVEVRFDRAFFIGSRHTCVVDQAKNLVSFDGGKPVPLPGTVPARK